MFDPKTVPSPYYRVAVKALIFNDDGQVLVVQNGEGLWEIPGGGWEHGESLRGCLDREIDEELGVGVATTTDIVMTYQGRNDKGYMALRLVVVATLASTDLRCGDGMVAARFVGASEFAALPMVSDDTPIKQLSADIRRLGLVHIKTRAIFG